MQSIRLSAPENELALPGPGSATFLPYLEGLRGIAALYVVLYHARNELLRDRPGCLAFVPFHGEFLQYGHLSVALFICISGYVLALPVVKHGELRGGPLLFFKRRARRLLPGYYVALLLSIPFALYNEHLEGMAFNGRMFLVQLGTHSILVHNFFSDTRIFHGLNGALWTIPVEFQIYAVFALVLLPIVFRFGLKTMVGTALVLGLLPECIGIARHHAELFRFGSSCFWFLGLFALGCAAAFLAQNKARLVRMPWGQIALAFRVVASVAIAIFWPSIPNETRTSMIDILLGLATASSFLSIAKSEAQGKRPLVARLLASRPCVALGAFSYSLYLIHEPIIRAFTHALARTPLTGELLTAVVFGAVVPATIAFAFAFSLAFERPFVSSYRRRAEDRLVAGLLPATATLPKRRADRGYTAI